MTIYEFILKHSTYGKELFESKEIMLKLRRMADDDKLEFLKQWDEKRKPKPKKTTKKVDNKKEKAYNDKTNGGKSEAKSVPRKRKRKTTSKGSQD
ncbi:MAG: hypothetical protein VW683_07760 [Betaproteobacteria bacterium]